MTTRTTTTTTTTTATAEQAAIIAAVKAGKNVLVSAKAGTGKTSTIKMIADALPGVQMLYLVYNKENQVNAQKVMPNWVECRTIHSLAHKMVMRGKMVEKSIDRTGLVRELINAKVFTCEKESRKYLNEKALPMMEKLCQSEYPNITGFRSEPEYKELSLIEWNLLVKSTNVVIKKWNSSNKVNFDWMLKSAQASKQTFKQYKIVLLDEAQDSNPVTLGLLPKFIGSQLVIVGDQNQGIYGWRGAVNALSDSRFDSFEKLSLTKSFRYGQDIADNANNLLLAIDKTQSLITGTEQTMPTKPTKAIICRTNLGVLSHIKRLINDNTPWYTEVNLYSIADAMYTIAEYHKVKGTDKTPARPEQPHPEIWGLYENYAEIKASGAFNIECLAVEAGYSAKQIYMFASKMSTRTKAEWIISTGHKTKGDEFNIVIVDDDFIPADFYNGNGLSKEVLLNWIAEQGLNLLYVVCTRARNQLILSEFTKAFILEIPEILNRE